MSLADVQRAVTRVCFSSTPSPEDLALVGSRERWMLYRSMVRDRLEKMVGSGLPRTKAALGDEAFLALVRAWFDADPPSSRYIREVVPAFLAHSSAAIAKSGVPFARDLATYECAVWEVGYDERELPSAAEFGFDVVPLVNPTLRLFDVAYNVNERPKEGATYLEKPLHLCVFRKRDDKAGSWTLNDMANDMMKRFVRGEETVTETVKAVASARGVTITQKFVSDLAGLLAGLIEQGAILGARP